MVAPALVTPEELFAAEPQLDAEHQAAAQDNVSGEEVGPHDATQLVQAPDFAAPPAGADAEGPATDGQVDLPPPEEAPLADFDPDVASIFTEEATELLEVCEVAAGAVARRSGQPRASGRAEAAAAYPQGWRAHGRHHRHG